MPSKHLRLAILSTALLWSTGCGVIKQQLRPLVCDCQTPPQRGVSDEALATALAIHQVGSACTVASDESQQVALQEDDASHRAPEAPQKEKIKAASSEQDVVNPILEGALLPLESDQERAAFQEKFSLSPPAERGALAFQGNFQSPGTQAVAVYVPGKSLTFYAQGQPLDTLNLSAYESEIDLQGLPQAPAQALELLRDGQAEIQLIQARVEEDGLTYYLGIYRLIGSFIGTIFHQPIAHRGEDGALRRLADMQVLSGREQRIIQWIPLDEDGQIAGEPVEYEWNKWEGVYRVPTPPPTAPWRGQPDS